MYGDDNNEAVCVLFLFNLPSVLVPGLDLCVCQVESRGQVHAVLHAEVFLSLEAPLQLVELVVREGCPCFARLFRAHRRTVSATGDLPVALFFSPWTTRGESYYSGGLSECGKFGPELIDSVRL